ncbi:hypothetical protein L2E82_28411 [Cichorium intybus]|uniref:Uncharacterized protein n=1 Tax=Cichorium intybus TaxID=13427 RepID=A0ACB9CVN5_CICIN|nr:hypothetical protein L2E82_28411 [Cichorium intybus]
MFFGCLFSANIWRWICEWSKALPAVPTAVPTDLQCVARMLEDDSNKPIRKLKTVVIYATIWMIWKSKNNMIFRNKLWSIVVPTMRFYSILRSKFAGSEYKRGDLVHFFHLRKSRSKSDLGEKSPRLKMPRYDDRYGTTRLYVGRLSSRTRSRDLEYLFSKYGRVRDVDMKHDFAFVEFSDPRDADDARYSLNGRDLNGSRLLVEFAKGTPRGPGGSREYVGRGPPPGSGRCFNCGLDGHWARDCKAGDWKNKCYRCGERGHIERNCQNSPKKLKRGRSYSRSPVRSRSPRRRRNRSPSYSHSPSYSRSRSPPKKERVVERERRTKSPRYSRSPSRSPEPRGSPPPSKGRNRSPTPNEDRVSPSPERVNSEYSMSPQRAGGSPSEPNGRSRSPSPGYERSPVGDDGPVVEEGGVAQGSPVDDEGEGPVVEGSPGDGEEGNREGSE